MYLRRLNLTRNFSTTKVLATPSLSADYKSAQLWEARFSCPLLNDTSKIKFINSKILNSEELNNLEVDIFINIAATRVNDISPLQEVAKILRQVRKSLHAHTILPSTHHATCRLFLESDRLQSLVTMLEMRKDFGLFPDAFALNLVFDETLKQGRLSLASRTAALMMLQEEFGLNKLSDMFALYSTAKYVESKTDFSDWKRVNIDQDPVFNEKVTLDSNEGSDKSGSTQEEATNKAEDGVEEENDEDEDDAEYLRVPFLRNPYFDHHFDLENPREICGKTLRMIGFQFERENSLGLAFKCTLLGSILQGHWTEVKTLIDRCLQSNTAVDATLKGLSQHYVDIVHNVEPPNITVKDSILSSLDKLSVDTYQTSLSDQAEQEFNSSKTRLEQNDIDWMRRVCSDWSEMRKQTLNVLQEVDARKKLVEEIRVRNEELKRRERFLYFYDELKKQSLTEIDYK